MEVSIEYTITRADWISVLPETILLCFGVLLILAGAFKNVADNVCYNLAKLGLIASGVAAVLSRAMHSTFFSMLSADVTFTLFFVLCAMFTVIMSRNFLAALIQKNVGEYFGILLIATAALSIFARSVHLMLTFVALETSAICFYGLIAWGRRNLENLEASIKYIIVSGVSGAFLLLGIAFVYASSFEIGTEMLYYGNFTSGTGNALFGVGAVLALSAVFFKLSAFPFQFWSSDVYQGAPTPITAFLAVASKSAATVVLYFMLISMPYSKNLILILSLSAALGIIVGNFGGLNEKNTKRIVAFSGIANAGYLMVFLASAVVLTNSVEDNSANLGHTLIFYVVSYAVALYAVFYVQTLNKSTNDANLCVTSYKGLWGKNPLASTALTLGLASLAGIPPTAGFFAKLFVLILAYAAGLYWLMIVLVLGSAASIFYYFKWIRAAFEPLEEGKKCEFYDWGFARVLIFLSFVILVFGVACVYFLL